MSWSLATKRLLRSNIMKYSFEMRPMVDGLRNMILSTVVKSVVGRLGCCKDKCRIWRKSESRRSKFSLNCANDIYTRVVYEQAFKTNDANSKSLGQ